MNVKIKDRVLFQDSAAKKRSSALPYAGILHGV